MMGYLVVIIALLHVPVPFLGEVNMNNIILHMKNVHMHLKTL